MFYSIVITCLLENIGNIVSSDSLYKGLVTFLDWSLPRIASDRCYISSNICTLSTLF